MATGRLLAGLPLPKHKGSAYDAGFDSWFVKRNEETAVVIPSSGKGKEPPPYGKRKGFVPRRVEDFGDGGAFPEIHVAQYPLEMGRKEEKLTRKTLPLNVDAEGNVAFDAIVRQGENRIKTVHSQHKDLVPKLQDIEDTDEALKRPSQEIAEETTERTKAVLEKIVGTRLSAAQPKSLPGAPDAPTFIKYTPTQQGAAFNSGAKERVIRMVEVPKDPLEPPKFRHRRVPKASGSPPVPVMHSPPRPVTVKDQQDWKIPPCISNWKNPKGYTIPLDKRLAADGRGLQDVQINDNFARLSEALYVAENKAREAVEMRSRIQKELMLKEREKKEQELRQLAQKARLDRAGGPAAPGIARDAGVAAFAPAGSEGAPRAGAAGGTGPLGSRGGADMDDDGEEAPRRGETDEERKERLAREAIREERRRERERERRLEGKDGADAAAGGGRKRKITRERERDVSEKVALGLANTGGGGGEVAYDQRLFNQEKGLESGFGAEDSYAVYDKGLFNREGAGGLYKVRKLTEEEMGGDAGGREEGGSSDRFRPDRGFAGATERSAPRDRPVEFEKAEADPFGLDQFLTQVRGKKAKN
eukprot:TRINITY_DN26523_c0_g1_i1.p1 TRINITY_DN26523_c0_g1~~TRINITY_DN26523_c0_g1_i1.p1  ORF type:complete len:587 (+),score=118.04 TRINITY_DN26523_c0_g1_i1:329-2089(+)